jgi:endonuclease YncB( thermonuclease family)
MGFMRVLIALSLAWWCLTSTTAAGSHECSKVLRVYDGDTILVSHAGGRHLVRLLGIDAPETSKDKGQPGQPFSARSRRHLATRVLDRCIRLQTYGDDRYGRRLAVLHLEGVNINLEMVSLGLAEVYRGRTPDGFNRRPYEKAEAAARRNRRGMWVQGEAYRSPIDWKHRH